jgi:hypothetical protein
MTLAAGCPECWAAVESWKPSANGASSPIREALVRVVSPGTWPVLSADHFEAVLEAKRQPGFLFLVAEEAALLATAEKTLEPIVQAVGLVALLGLQGDALASAFVRLYAVQAEAHVARGEKPEAEESLVRAGSYLGRAKNEIDVASRVRLLEAQARFARRFGAAKDAEGLYVKALGLVCPGSPLRHLELMVDAATLGLWEPADSERRIVGAVNLTSTLRGSSRPAGERAHALLRTARFLVRALKHEKVAGEAEVVELLGAELEAAEDLFATAAPITRAFADMFLASLRSFYAPDRVPELTLRAAETFEAGGLAQRAQRARGLLPAVEELAQVALEVDSGS